MKYSNANFSKMCCLEIAPILAPILAYTEVEAAPLFAKSFCRIREKNLKVLKSDERTK